MENILNLEHMIDDDTRSLAIAPREVFWPFGLFHDVHSEKYNFPKNNLGHSRPSLACLYRKIIQVKLTSVNINLHIT